MRTLATDEVLTANINDDAVTTAKVLDDAVTTAKVLDDAVTAAKLADSAYLANRNIFINGACQVNQRGNSTGQTGSAYHSVDRFYTAISSIGTYSFSQESDGPDGFANSWKIDCTTADASPAAGDLLVLQCKFEGQDLQQLKKGTASAESLTLSFWVKSYQTGNYQVNLIDNDNSRVIGTTFTISSSATWEYKTVTFAGDTTGALGDDANTSLYIEWWFDSGTDFSSGAVPTSWEALANTDRNAGGTIRMANSTSNYCQLTGIQLELGTVATPFEHKTFADELRACQRYFEKQVSGSAYGEFGNGYAESASQSYINVKFAVEKRANPSYVGAALRVVNQGAAMIVTSDNVDQGGTQMTKLSLTGSGGLTTARATMCSANNNATANMQWDAEL